MSATPPPDSAALAPSESDDDLLYRSVQRILADPDEIHEAALKHLDAHRRKGSPGGDGGRDPGGSGDGGTSDDPDDMRRARKAATKVISNYSYLAGMSGGATALAGVVPGLGTVASVVGGTTADIVVLVKLQIRDLEALRARPATGPKGPGQLGGAKRQAHMQKQPVG